MKLYYQHTILCIIFLLFGACNEEKRSQFVIGVSQCSDDLWREAMNQEIEREITFYPQAEVIIKNVKDNTQKQLDDIEKFIEQKVDLLIIAPNESEVFTPVVQKAEKQGIPVVLVDRKIETEDYTAYIGADNYQIGKEAALYAASVLSGKGKIVEIRGWKGSTPDRERHLGFIDALKNFPDIQVITEVYGDFLKDKAKEQMIPVFQNHNGIDLVFAFNDRMALGAYEASLQFSGKKPFIIGVDALQSEGVKFILRGEQNASFLYPTGGDKVVELAMKILQKQPFLKENILSTTVIDQSNIRILQLQTEQITEKQRKIDQINNSLNASLIKYANQKALFYVAIAAILLVTLFLIIAIRAYRTKSRINQHLKLKNIKIQRQSNILQEQKERLEIISRQLEEATQAKLMFFTNISHEFKTPLSLILGPLETLTTDTNLTQQQQELLFIIQKNSHRLSNLISEIIEFRKLEHGKMQMHFTKGDLKLFLEGINSLFANWIKQKRIHFEFFSQEDSFEIDFDKGKVEKIYINLVANALKFVNQQGKIRISLNKEGKGVCMSIFNTGSFIPKDKLTNIFEHFYKVDPSSEGTGIGLALTALLVEAHKGRISVQSSEKEGTTFQVWLPLEQENISSNGTYEPNYLQTQMKLLERTLPESFLPANENIFASDCNEKNDKPLILIVEDNSEMRKFINYVLRTDFNLIEAENGEEGFEKAKKYVPDLVISDVIMPKKDGFEFCKSLKQNVLTSHIPVVMLTAYSLDEQKQIGFESGADAYIAKPFNVNLLQIRVRKLIENRRKIQEIFSNNLFEPIKKESLGDIEDKFLVDFRQYVEKHLANPNLSVDELSDYLGISRSQLYRKIKSLTNYSPNELVRIIRVQQGRQLLLQNTKIISEIAYEIGFSSPSYFAKCFKDFYNEAPKDFLEKIKG